MSDWKKGGPGPIPTRWLHCPRKSTGLIVDKFLAFKTPLSSNFDSQVPDENKFTIDMLLSSMKHQKRKIGLWIDLTKTKRFYDKREVEKNNIRYIKMECEGHGETPTPEQVKVFITICKNYIAQNPLDLIGVHCTHGFNRTGFLIISYLVEALEWGVDAGIAHFASLRPPGIYKDDYIQELYRRYDDIEDATTAPPRPAWCLEYDDSNIEDTDEVQNAESDTEQPPTKKRKKEYFKENPVFMLGVPGVTPILDRQKASGIQRRVQEICHWEKTGFPGSQPVSMDVENIRLLHEKPYRVSWKADGTRYMMLIQSEGDIYFVDRDNSIFQVNGLVFPYVRDCRRKLKDTLLDGEMVIDKTQGQQLPRYLVYDVIMYDGKDVSRSSFFPDRYSIIGKEIIHARHQAMREGRIIKEKEPFSIRCKEFWDLDLTEKLLSDKFAAQLSHEPDGLIFQPAKEPYQTGQCLDILKWKPASLNSVDFKLKVVVESGEGILRKLIGELYVGGLDVPFAKMNKVSKQLKELNSKIIECKFENGQWVFMRERIDKSFPNSYKTAHAVCGSILKPVTKEILIDYIKDHRFPQDDSELMPPPRHQVR